MSLHHDCVRLENVVRVGRFLIKRRVGPAVRTQRLPQYTVWASARCLEEFRRLASAQKWCQTADVLPKSRWLPEADLLECLRQMRT